MHAPTRFIEALPVAATTSALRLIGDSVMQLIHPERRELARLPLEILLWVRVSGADRMDFAMTRDVSARGIYFHTSAQLRVGQQLECVLVLPKKLTQATAPLLVSCQAKVLRLTKSSLAKSIGVAVEVCGYDFSWQELPVVACQEVRLDA